MTRGLRLASLALLAAYAFVVVLLAGRQGLGLSPDSISYLAGAHSFADSGRMLSYTGEPFTLFPPGLPALLSVFVRIGVDPVTVALLLNAACGALLVLGIHWLARITLGSPLQALGVAAVVAVSPALVQNMSMLWTEPGFSVLVVALLIVLAGSARDQRGLSWRSMLLSAAIVWGATSFRYVGALLVAVVVVGAWLAGPARHPADATVGRSTTARAGWALLAGALAAIGPAVLVLRNLLLGDGALGERYPGTQTIPGAVQRAVTLWGSYLLNVDEGTVRTVAGLGVAGLLVVGAGLALMRRASPMLVVVVFLALYWAAIWWSQSTTRIDVVSDRLGFPAFAPTVLVVWSAVIALVAEVANRAPRTTAVVGGLALGVLLASLTSASAQFAATAGREGRGYATAAAKDSALAAALAALPAGTGVASDDPWHAWWALGHGPAVHVPPLVAQWPRERVEGDLALLTERVTDGSVQYVAYFDGAEAAMTPADLAAAGFTLTPVATVADGRLYRISREG
jgi:hypothetical protein